MEERGETGPISHTGLWDDSLEAVSASYVWDASYDDQSIVQENPAPFVTELDTHLIQQLEKPKGDVLGAGGNLSGSCSSQ